MEKKTTPTSRIALAIAIVSLILAGYCLMKSPASKDATPPKARTTMNRVRQEKVLRVGYGVWSPYTMLDEKMDIPKGFSVDLINEIAKKSDLKVEFIRFKWETLKPDLMRGKWDVAIEPVFMTMPRAMDFGFTAPYGKFGIACAVVKKDDDRFKNFSDLERGDITIALAAGWTSSEYAKQNLTKPKFQMVTIQQDNFAQLNEVLLGRSDVALNDAPTVYQFVKEHSDKVKALWLKNPPSMVLGGMLTRSEDIQFTNFLSNAIRVLEADGTLERLDRKWKPQCYYPSLNYRLSEGFKE